VSANDSVCIVIAQESFSLDNGDVSLVADTGPYVVGGLWEYRAQGVISDASPTSGHDCDDQRHERLVTLAGWPATIVTQTDDVVMVEAGSGAFGTGDAVLTSASGATVRRVNGRTYLTVNVTSVTPSFGQLGTFANILGSGLLLGGSSIVRVSLASVNVASVVFASNGNITVRAAASNVSTGSVVVVMNTGATLTLANAWTYIAAGIIDSVQPNFGHEGTRVNITGRGVGSVHTSAPCCSRAAATQHQGRCCCRRARHGRCRDHGGARRNHDTGSTLADIPVLSVYLVTNS
jgi:hypothetical protein